MESFSPGVVLAAYAEPLLEGRRVVVFGDGTSSLAAELLERGARGVHVYDPEPTRAALAAGQNRVKQVSIVPLDDADIAVRDGAFDVAIVEDLSTARDPAALLKRVRRALSARGAAIVASPNPDMRVSLVPRTTFGRADASLGYYELYDVVSAEFPEVRMLGQTPFVGYAIVDFAPEGEPEVSIDSGLVPGGAEEPEWFVALAGQSPVETEAFSIVQLPSARVTTGADAGLSEDLRAARSAEARLVERVAELEAQATALREKANAPRADPSKDRADALEKELAKRQTALAELEARQAAASARADAAVERVEALRPQHEALRAQHEALQRQHEAKYEALRTQHQALRVQHEALRTQHETVRTQHEEALRSERAGASRSESSLAEKARNELARLGSERTELETQLGVLSTEKTELSKRVLALSAERDQLDKKLSAAASNLTQQASQLSAEKTAAAKKLETLASERAAEKESGVRALSTRDAEVAQLSKQLEEQSRSLKKLLDPADDEASVELTRLETTLRDRGEQIRKLESDLREAERIGKELVRELAKLHQLSAALPSGALPSGGRLLGAMPAGLGSRGEGGALATENARLVADLEAAGWTIQELEDRLAQTRN